DSSTSRPSQSSMPLLTNSYETITITVAGNRAIVTNASTRRERRWLPMIPRRRSSTRRSTLRTTRNATSSSRTMLRLISRNENALPPAPRTSGPPVLHRPKTATASPAASTTKLSRRRRVLSAARRATSWNVRRSSSSRCEDEPGGFTSGPVAEGCTASRASPAMAGSVEQRALFARRLFAEMAPRARRRDATARGFLQEAAADQVRLVDFFDSVGVFAERGGERVDADRPALESFDERDEQAPVHRVEAGGIDAEHVEAGGRDVARDAARRLDLGVVTKTLEQAVRDARRSACALGQKPRRGRLDLERKARGRAPYDLGQLLFAVELERVRVAEAPAQRRSQHAGARRRGDQRKALQRERDRARRRPFADHDVDAVVLHRRIEDLFDGFSETVDLVDEQHVAALERRQDGRKVTGLFDDGSARRMQPPAHRARDDVRERRLAETGRADQQQVIERFAARARGANRDVEIATNGRLSDVVVERLRTQADVRGGLLGRGVELVGLGFHSH